MLVPEAYQDLLKDETRAFAFLATLMDDGSPQVTPVWFDVEDGFIWLNSAKGRVKDRNMRARQQVALCIMDPRDPYRYIQLRGEIVEWDEVRGRDHINRLSKKYTGREIYNGPPQEQRVVYKFKPYNLGNLE
jgi:hypothetical protein